MKRAATFGKVLKLEIPGETMEARASWLYENLPIGVIEAIYSAILELSGDPLKDALFTSTAS